MKKIGFVIIILCIALWPVYHFVRPWILPKTFVSGWGAGSVSRIGASEQNVTFQGTVSNEGLYPVYVKKVEVVFTDPVKSRFISGDHSIPIGKWLKPGKTVDFSGKWVFSTEGITDSKSLPFNGIDAKFEVKLNPF